MIRNKYIILLLGLVLLIGCRPKGIISSREMRDILIDLHKTDGLLQVCGYQHGYDETRNIYYAMVLEKHGITQAQFDSSLVWYTNNPQIFNKIYPKVMERLEADLSVEEQIREANREKKLANRKKGVQPKRHLREIEEVQKEMRNGMENPWKEWKSEEFCEKDVVIFGQLEKKL